MKPEGRALIVAAQFEAAEPGDRILAPLDVHLLDDAPELANTGQSGLHVVHPEEHVRRRPSIAAVHAARDLTGLAE